MSRIDLAGFMSFLFEICIFRSLRFCQLIFIYWNKYTLKLHILCYFATSDADTQMGALNFSLRLKVYTREERKSHEQRALQLAGWVARRRQRHSAHTHKREKKLNVPICCRNIDLLFLSLRELNFSFSLCVWRLLWAFYLNSHFISFHVFSFHWQTRDGRPCAAAPLPQMSKTFCFALFFSLRRVFEWIVPFISNQKNVSLFICACALFAIKHNRVPLF